MKLKKAIECEINIIMNNGKFDFRLIKVVDGKIRIWPHHSLYEKNDQRGYDIIERDDPILESEGWF